MGSKYNTRSRKKSIQGLRSFKDSLPKNIKEKFLNKGNTYSKIINNWEQIVGIELSKICLPKSFIELKKSDEKRLIVTVEKGHEVDVEYAKNIIINGINNFLGYKLVNKIKLISYKKD
tara:strand:+ start:41 stop:394 length:354 start_codon:yes stop_codon:yes gene_type:complete